MYPLRYLVFVITCMAVCAFTACTKPSQIVGADATSNQTSAGSARASLRDLERDESLGGHTLSRHVGKSDDELRDRLKHEHISASSTYTDRAAAEQAVGSAIEANHERIGKWVSAAGGHPNLVLDYDSAQPIGRTLRRGQTLATSCSHAVVVLKWRPPGDYYVLTSYPECK